MWGLVLFFLLLLMFAAELTVPTFIKELRKCESPIEKRLFRSLWLKGHRPISQYPVKPYRLDMALPALKIAIEADGKAFHSSSEQKAHDRKRDAYLRSKGWIVLRFTGSQIHRNINSVIKNIEAEIHKKTY